MRIPRTKRGVIAYICAVAVLTFTIFATSYSEPLKTAHAPAPSPIAQTTTAPVVLGTNEEIHKVTRVVDGDTIVIDTNQKVRLIGVDAPETVDPKKSIQCFGAEASAFAKNLLLNKDVTLTKDISETDSFGRLLRYVYLGDTFVNETLVRQGYAYSKTYPPDIAHQELFKEAERDAFANNRGIWGPACKNK